jgi:hypothetical protein
MNQALDQECADEIRIAAWRAMLFDDLHGDARLLAQAIDDSTYRQSPGALEDLLGALMSTDPHATAADNLMMQHQAAIKVIDRLVQEVVDSEEKQGHWRSYAE